MLRYAIGFACLLPFALPAWREVRKALRRRDLLAMAARLQAGHGVGWPGRKIGALALIAAGLWLATRAAPSVKRQPAPG